MSRRTSRVMFFTEDKIHRVEGHFLLPYSNIDDSTLSSSGQACSLDTGCNTRAVKCDLNSATPSQFFTFGDNVLVSWIQNLGCSEMLCKVLPFLCNLSYNDLVGSSSLQDLNNTQTYGTRSQNEDILSSFRLGGVHCVPRNSKWFNKCC